MMNQAIIKESNLKALESAQRVFGCLTVETSLKALCSAFKSKIMYMDEIEIPGRNMPLTDSKNGLVSRTNSFQKSVSPLCKERIGLTNSFQKSVSPLCKERTYP